MNADHPKSGLSKVLQHSLRHTSARSHYRLLGLVGQGQFGKVFLGVHRTTGQLFALKELDQDRFPTHQFLRELRLLVTLQHPNIVTCWACEYWMQHRYLVTDYCEGGTLRQWMDSHASLSFGQRNNTRQHVIESLSMVEGILSGLAHAHEQNIIHCDIKPENILLEVRSNYVLPRIADFGIARVTQDLQKASFSGTGMSGSPAYMAPERFFGQHSVSADLYAIGILLYELLMGDRPFSGTPGALRSAHLNHIVQIPEALPESLKIILLRALAKLPGQRYRTAQEMRSAILTTIEELRHKSTQISNLTLTIEQDIPNFVLDYYPLDTLSHPIQQLLIQPLDHNPHSNHPAHSDQVILYRIEATKVQFERYQIGTIDRPLIKITTDSIKTTHRLSDLVERAWGSMSSCYIATTSQLYYCDEDWLKPCLDYPNANLIAVDPLGYWFVQVHDHSIQLFYPEQPDPRWIRVCKDYLPLQVCAIDSRHFVVLSQIIENPTTDLHSQSQSQSQSLQADQGYQTSPFERQIDEIGIDEIGKSRESADRLASPRLKIEIWNRRGQIMGQLQLQIAIDRLWPIPSQSYLIATAQESPRTLVFIQLQPLQVRRLLLPFEPKVVVLLARGVLTIAAFGLGLVLNREGEVVARLKFPEGVTAGVMVDDRYLLLATWATGCGNFAVFDLEPLLGVF